MGKSCVGVQLARRLGYTFFDTDSLVVDACGCSVAEIVHHEGWQVFRAYERRVLLQLSTERSCVVATGGGAILHRDVWSGVKQQGVVVWLTADAETLRERIRTDQISAEQRPSLTGKEICQELESVLEERAPLYGETADCIIDSAQMTVDEAVQAIVQMCDTTGGE